MVTIGNGCKGVSIYCEGKEDIHVPWKDIAKISYKKDKFRIIYYVHEQVCECVREHSESKTLIDMMCRHHSSEILITVI